MSARPSILFLFSDTGGGHRSAAEAIIEALKLEFDDRVSTRMVDIFKEYAPRPLNKMPDLYPKMVLIPQAWGLGYRLSNGHRRTRLMVWGSWPYVHKSIRTLFAENPCDLIVSVHPLATASALRVKTGHTPVFFTVVTDLVSTHAFWYNRRNDLCLVPTEEARQRALNLGLNPDQVEVVGLPVADRFCVPVGNKQAIRASLGWSQDMPVVLLVGGGEGMGPLEKNAQAIAQAGLPVSLVIVAGRNKKLITRLEEINWKIPTHIYGFVKEMPEFMRAADILVTKAGPSTISEALNAGLPMILYSRLPGQEDGNVSYVVSQGAGLWAPDTDRLVNALSDWLNNPEARQQAALACQRLAKPQAARLIARRIAGNLGIC